ncbi:MAG: PP2C family protein-serine/threonine phosphatase [Blastocatellia bacterium]
MTERSKECDQPSKTGANQREGGKGEAAQKPASSMIDVDLFAQSNSGSVGPNNEDQYLAVRVERSLKRVLSNLPDDLLPQKSEETAYGMCVADGIGAMPAGNLASALALSTLLDLVVATPDWIMRINHRKAAVVKRRMTQRFRKIDAALRTRSESDPRLFGMGTTLTVACSLGDDLFLAHIGDSRAYLLREDELHQLTRDHTLAQAMIDAGVAGPEDAAVQGLRGVLTAALGSTYSPTDPQVRRVRLASGDQLLLCTDGLTEYLDSDGIRSVLREASSSNAACGELIQTALSAGCTNDIAVVLARYRFPSATRRQDSEVQ